MIYRWRSGARLEVNAQEAGERLETLHEQHDGSVTPRVVVDDAVDDDSPLHDAFEWDDGVAADTYRIGQARSLVRSLVVLSEREHEPAQYRAYVRITGGEKTGKYVPTYRAMSDDAMRDEVLGRALKELKQWRERYHELQELAVVFEAIDGGTQQLAAAGA